MNERAVQRRMARNSAKGAAHILPSASSSVTITHGRVITDVIRLTPMRESLAIRTFLLQRLHSCLRAPSMCGGELGVLNLMEYVTFIDEREDEWYSYRRDLTDTGAFRSTGLHGGFWSATKQDNRTEIQPASVYAKIAFEMGYLSIGNDFDVVRVLSTNEFSALTDQLDDDFFDSEWTNHDVLDRFGAPSLRWGTNDNYPCILLYLEDGASNRFCYFDCWAEFYEDGSGCAVPGKYGPKPILRNVRVPADSFIEQFRFTNFGRALSERDLDNGV